MPGDRERGSDRVRSAILPTAANTEHDHQDERRAADVGAAVRDPEHDGRPTRAVQVPVTLPVQRAARHVGAFPRSRRSRSRRRGPARNAGCRGSRSTRRTAVPARAPTTSPSGPRMTAPTAAWLGPANGGRGRPPRARRRGDGHDGSQDERCLGKPPDGRRRAGVCAVAAERVRRRCRRRAPAQADGDRDRGRPRPANRRRGPRHRKSGNRAQRGRRAGPAVPATARISRPIGTPRAQRVGEIGRQRAAPRVSGRVLGGSVTRRSCHERITSPDTTKRPKELPVRGRQRR